MSIATLTGDQRLPRYQRLADVLRNEIRDGTRKAGDKLPSENVIAEEYGLAPGTARKALAQLVEEGILERAQGRGTFVRRPSFDQSLFRFFRLRSKENDAVVPESKIRSRKVKTMPNHVARKLEQPVGTSGIQISRIRVIDGTPVLLEDIWLKERTFKAFLELDESEIGPLLYPIYDTHCGQIVASADEVLTVERASGDTTRFLKLTSGDPIVCVERLAKGLDGTPLEWRRSSGPASLFQYQIEIR